MAKRKSLGGNAITPIVPSKAAVPANKNSIGGSSLSGGRAGKARKSKGGKRTLNTLAGKSGIMNPPQGGGYNG